jgi:hypothetical protein
MSDEPIPEDVQEFILSRITSIAQLEALLLLWRDPKATWDIATMARRLYISDGEAKGLLSQLSADGFALGVDDAYRFDTSDLERFGLVTRVAEVYRRHLISVTNLIHAKPPRIREFADAFRLRKDR